MRRGIKVVPISASAVALLLLCLPGIANQQVADQLKMAPVLQVDIRQFGYEVPKRIYSKGNQLSEEDVRGAFGDFQLPSLDFTDKTTLAVYFERYDTEARHLVLRLLLVDVRTGALRWQQEWPTKPLRWFRGPEDTQSSVLPVHQGQFLVHVNNTLKLYSPDFKLVLERELPVNVRDEAKTLHPAGGTGVAFLTAAGDTWAANVAPGGHVVVLTHIEGKKTTTEWVTVDDLKEVQSLTDTNSFFSESASERAVTAFYDKAVQIRTAEKEVRVLCDRTSCPAGSPLFLTNDEVLVEKHGDTQGFSVLSTHGDMLWSREGRFSCNGLLGGRRSLDGRRFALLFDICGRRAQFDGVKLPRGGEAILVYDRESRSIVFINRTPRIRFSGGGWHYALSPDGSYLAVRDETKVLIYAIPNKLEVVDSK